jgi:polyisoprenoid-binding protein YceI
MNDTELKTKPEKEMTTANKVNWKLDPAHSEITFQVKHMMITNVRGSLKDYTIEVESEDEHFANAKIYFSGKMNSITTNNDQRDTHLRSADFFDVEKNPEITFKSTSYKKTNGDNYKLEGDLTIKGVTKKIALDVKFAGIQKDPWGNEKAGFSVSGKVNRKNFGLNWNTILETGGAMVSDDVNISCEIELIKEQ